MTFISKSRFVSGVQCEKKLFFDLYRKDLKSAITKRQEDLLNNGNEVGILAQSLFPDGEDASPDSYFDFSDAVRKTTQWISEGVKTIYEAAFFYDNVLAALDIFHAENGECWAIEVKSSTSLKNYHITDAALQYWVMDQSRHKPDKFFLMYVNANYIREGHIDSKAFFKLVDITKVIISKQEWVGEQLNKFKKLDGKSEPEKEIGIHCKNPFACEYIQHCWEHIPKNSVFDISSARGKDWKLYNLGISRIEDIPDEISLNHRQRVQVEGVKRGASFIDKNAIDIFLKSWNFPLFFLDFETIFPAIPILDRTSPYQQIPFQYSLHIADSKNSDLVHKEFLAIPLHFHAKAIIKDPFRTIPTKDEEIEDPRKSLIEQLKKDIGPSGSIVAYNASFEKNVLKDLALAFPEDKIFLNGLIHRFVDLLLIFRKAWFYKPEMGSSVSIKSVLPAIAPEFSYKDLEIANGGDASTTFYSMVSGTFEGKEEEIRNQLLKYCKRDTEGMVVIWKEMLDRVI